MTWNKLNLPDWTRQCCHGNALFICLRLENENGFRGNTAGYKRVVASKSKQFVKGAQTCGMVSSALGWAIPGFRSLGASLQGAPQCLSCCNSSAHWTARLAFAAGLGDSCCLCGRFCSSLGIPAWICADRAPIEIIQTCVSKRTM